MAKKAVDVVLLPSDDIIHLVGKLNMEAWRRGQATIEINPAYRLPHISLLMGVLDDEHTSLVQEKMKEIADKTPAMHLAINKIENKSFTIEKIPEIQKLHEEVVNEINPILGHEASKEMYAEPQGYTLYQGFEYWVNNFDTHHSFERFWPHISTHANTLPDIQLPIACKVTRFALCHLGDHNTCRTILYETTLATS
ncbi:MAG: hypothetical protein A3J66_03205 [Candidatus Magasanikbacteria bacterium RIFCSPHIGHO2_02_FULL_47_14]|uniref:2'-5' RNA ligase n=1 Tax=Candidatus Magasanikbacteria bacterium RIFCSPHIGHO2_02_FULL_47_14 TaxID=1798680 RepID=A0A1F6M8L2_9BACT|nr:MAG: hypothetical protein A3J66_03205 [Candidatus Magasanikbacteria bacterium RIFCSPHIGHO2_02_FULL_47_14]